jgi:hypothetical protein
LGSPAVFKRHAPHIHSAELPARADTPVICGEAVISSICLLCLLLTSGPFGHSMSAAGRPKRRGVSRQAKGKEFDPTKVGLFALLEMAC